MQLPPPSQYFEAAMSPLTDSFSVPPGPVEPTDNVPVRIILPAPASVPTYALPRERPPAALRRIRSVPAVIGFLVPPV